MKHFIRHDVFFIVPASLSLHVPVTKYSPPLSSEVTLRCTINSGTPISVGWQLDNIPINVADSSRYSGGNINNPSLTISSVDKNDLGFYMCVASNAIVTVISDNIALLPVGKYVIIFFYLDMVFFLKMSLLLQQSSAWCIFISSL